MWQDKSPWYTHRLMHRKRVTSEQYDSYFRLMTIKHAIPKIEWAIECAIELIYNSVKTGSQRVGERSWRKGVVWKATTQQKGPLGPPMELETRWWQDAVEKAAPSRVGLWASGWAALENEKDTTLMAIRVGVNILQSLFSLQLPLTRKPCNKVRGIFFKEVLVLYWLSHYDSACISRCICMRVYNINPLVLYFASCEEVV